jgi:uncharacterized Zn finger protein (UPF0148 family)
MHTASCTTCDRCGQVITNIYDHQGKTYGPECIGKVTGVSVRNSVFREVRTGDRTLKILDPEATERRKAWRAYNKAIDDLREAMKEEARVRSLPLKEKFKGWDGTSMANCPACNATEFVGNLRSLGYCTRCRDAELNRRFPAKPSLS